MEKAKSKVKEQVNTNNFRTQWRKIFGIIHYNKQEGTKHKTRIL